MLIGAAATFGIVGGGRRLSRHVVAVGEAPSFRILGMGQRLLDRLTGDELLAHHPNRQIHAAANDRLARTCHR
jgi:hypothetical protein